MAISTTTVPYELMFRWDNTGALVGAHFQKRYVMRDGDKLVGESVGDLLPLAPGSADVRNILSDAYARALADSTALKERQSAFDAAKQAHVAAVAAEAAARDDEFNKAMAELEAAFSQEVAEVDKARRQFMQKEAEYIAQIEQLKVEVSSGSATIQRLLGGGDA